MIRFYAAPSGLSSTDDDHGIPVACGQGSPALLSDWLLILAGSLTRKDADPQMPGDATIATKEQWLEILKKAASGYPDGARDPKQTRSRRRQLDLLEAATRVFARDGIAKSKMADIAAEAGISVSSIYDYYPSKEDLAYEIPIRRLSQFYTEFLERALDLRSMQERLHLFLCMAIDYARRNPDWARLLYLEIWPSVLIEETRVRRALDDFGRIVVSMLREGSRRGEWDVKLDPYQTATILMGSITHMIITWLLYRRPENLSKATKPIVDQLLKLVSMSGEIDEASSSCSRRA